VVLEISPLTPLSCSAEGLRNRWPTSLVTYAWIPHLWSGIKLQTWSIFIQKVSRNRIMMNYVWCSGKFWPIVFPTWIICGKHGLWFPMISCRQSFKVAAEALSPVTVQSFRREGGPNMRWWGQEGRSPWIFIRGRYRSRTQWKICKVIGRSLDPVRSIARVRSKAPTSATHERPTARPYTSPNS